MEYNNPFKIGDVVVRKKERNTNLWKDQGYGDTPMTIRGISGEWLCFDLLKPKDFWDSAYFDLVVEAPPQSPPNLPALSTQVGGDHYKSLAIQPVEYITKNNLGWCEGNIIKYTTRWKQKGGKADIDKVIHYANLLKEMN